MIVAVLAGGIILFPSLALLFRLMLGGNLGAGESAADAAAERHPVPVAGNLVGRGAVALLVVGLGFLTVANAGWAHAIGVTALLIFAALATRALISSDVLT